MLHRSPTLRRLWPALMLAALLAGPANCGSPRPPPAAPPSARESTPEAGARSREADLTNDESIRFARQPRVLVIAARCQLPEDVVEAALGEALGRRQVLVLETGQAQDADAVLLVGAGQRAAGAWGGNMPSCEVFLRYVLLDPGTRRPAANGQKEARWSEATAESAAAKALAVAAERVADGQLKPLAQLASSGKPADASASDPPARPTVACLPFRNLTRRPELDGWCAELATLAAQELNRTGKYRLVERARVSDVLDEQDLGLAVSESAQKTRDLGERFHADLLLLADVAVRPDGQLSLSARLVAASDAEIVGTFNASGPDARAAAPAFLRRLSKPIPDWIIKYLDQLCPAR